MNKKLIGSLLLFAGILIAAATSFSGTDEPTISNGIAVWPQYYNGTNFKHPRVDASTRATTGMDYMHHEIHEGNAFFVSGTTVIGSGLTNQISFATPSTAKQVHFTMQIGSSGIANVYLIENRSFKTVEGNLVSGATPYNHDRNSATVSGCTVGWIRNSSPLASGSIASGTTIYDYRIGTNGIGQTTIGGAADRENEVILRSGTTYVLLFYSGAAANNINYAINWYEHTPESD